MRITLIAATILLALFAAVMLATGQAHAADTQRVLELQPVHCGAIRCHQLRTVSFYTHGQPTLVVTQRHGRPVESRNALPLPPFNHWHTVGAVVLPCCASVAR